MLQFHVLVCAFVCVYEWKWQKHNPNSIHNISSRLLRNASSSKLWTKSESVRQRTVVMTDGQHQHFQAGQKHSKYYARGNIYDILIAACLLARLARLLMMSNAKADNQQHHNIY